MTATTLLRRLAMSAVTVLAMAALLTDPSAAQQAQPTIKKADPGKPATAQKTPVKPAPQAVQTPTQVIEAFNASLLKAMKEGATLGFDGRVKLLDPSVRKTYDLQNVARRAAGPHWEKFTAAQQKQYVEAFTRLSATTYAGRFKSFDGEEFKLLGAEDTSRGDTVVKTEIITSKKEHVAINYLMRKTDSGWRVIDVFVKGTISEVATKRSDFGAVLNQSGFDGLMAAIEKKIADAKAG